MASFDISDTDIARDELLVLLHDDVFKALQDKSATHATSIDTLVTMCFFSRDFREEIVHKIKDSPMDTLDDEIQAFSEKFKLTKRSKKRSRSSSSSSDSSDSSDSESDSDSESMEPGEVQPPPPQSVLTRRITNNPPERPAQRPSPSNTFSILPFRVVEQIQRMIRKHMLYAGDFDLKLVNFMTTFDERDQLYILGQFAKKVEEGARITNRTKYIMRICSTEALEKKKREQQQAEKKKREQQQQQQQQQAEKKKHEQLQRSQEQAVATLQVMMDPNSAMFNPVAAAAMVNPNSAMFNPVAAAAWHGMNPAGAMVFGNYFPFNPFLHLP